METKQKQSAQRIICHMDLRILDAYNLRPPYMIRLRSGFIA